MLLWQEFKHDDNTFEDLLALLVGETLAVRAPRKQNVERRNTARMFFTSNSPLYAVRPDPHAIRYLSRAMDERFCARAGGARARRHARNCLPKCSRCCATFYFQYR